MSVMNDSRQVLAFTAGNPTADEIAAVTAVLYALAARAEPTRPEVPRFVPFARVDYCNPNSWQQAA